jgi:hypothetical protein
LSESTIAIDHREYVSFADYAQGLSGAEIAGFEPADIPGDPDNTMTVVACQVGRCKVPGNPLAFLWTAASFSKNIGNYRTKWINLNQHTNTLLFGR